MELIIGKKYKLIRKRKWDIYCNLEDGIYTIEAINGGNFNICERDVSVYCTKYPYSQDNYTFELVEVLPRTKVNRFALLDLED